MAEGVLDLVWLFGETNRTMLKGASASKASGGTSFLCGSEVIVASRYGRAPAHPPLLTLVVSSTSQIRTRDERELIPTEWRGGWHGKRLAIFACLRYQRRVPQRRRHFAICPGG